MISEAIKVLGEHGWAAVILFIFGGVLIRFLSVQISVWKARSVDQIMKLELRRQSELKNHQFFANIHFRLHSEIPTLTLNKDQPVREDLFRTLLTVTLISLKEIIDTVVGSNLDGTPSEWATNVNREMQKHDRMIEEKAVQEGIPLILISRYIVWKRNSDEVLNNYVNDLAISEVYVTNLARTNTLLVGLNGEISGMTFKGKLIE